MVCHYSSVLFPKCGIQELTNDNRSGIQQEVLHLRIAPAALASLHYSTLSIKFWKCLSSGISRYLRKQAVPRYTCDRHPFSLCIYCSSRDLRRIILIQFSLGTIHSCISLPNPVVWFAQGSTLYLCARRISNSSLTHGRLRERQNIPKLWQIEYTTSQASHWPYLHCRPAWTALIR